MPEISGDISDLFRRALESHQAGRLAEAERLYRQVLAAEPRHADSLHLLGIVAYQAGRPDLAADLIGQAIAIDGSQASYHSNLGNALKAQARPDEAIACFRRALDLRPDLAPAWNDLGSALQDRGRPDEAASCFRRALDIKPDYAEAHNNLANSLKAQGRSEEAVAAYSRAIELMPRSAEAQYNLGNVLHELGRVDVAIACYGNAVDINPNYADAHHNLGTALCSRGRFEDAKTAYLTALRLGGNPANCFFGLSLLRKFADADRPLIGEMMAALNDPGCSSENRALLGFALGKCLDDLGEYEPAIRYFDEANRFERMKHPFDRAAFAATVDWLIRAFPKGMAPAVEASQSELPVLIVGMPRSGTSLTEQILASHPKIAAAGELDFWLKRSAPIRTRMVDRLAPAAERDAIHAYLELLAAIAGSAARVTDKMPTNFLALGLVHRLFPRARIIHCRRNPVDTSLSIYFTRFARGSEFSNSREDIAAYYREYLRLMDHWRRVLPPDRFIEIDYERLVADQETASRALVAFCGLDWDDSCIDFHKTDRPIATASAWQARQPLYRTSVERWRRYEPWLGELRDLMQ